MASLCPLTSSFTLCNSSARIFSKRNSRVASNKQRSSHSLRCKLPDVTTIEETTVLRRSANYEPSLWSYDFVQSLSSIYKGEKYMTRSQTLKDVVRTMICKEIGMTENPLSILNLVDDLQRLGISYHFIHEITSLLKKIYVKYYNNQEKWINMDLNLKSLGFRLLRQHGYHIPQEIFSDCIEANGSFKGHLYKDITGMLNLYEASYHSVEDETILDDAREYTQKCLEKVSLENLGDENMLSLIRHSLEFPLHWRVPRVEAKWYIDSCETRSDMNPTVLELAILDFNMVQAVHQEELKHTSNWWKETGWENFGFGRDRLVENFMWSVAGNHLPHFQGRRDIARVFALITTIDDVYDVYGTFYELEQFTNAVNSWDVNQIEDFPEYMKICFLAFYNAINEISYYILTDKRVHLLPYLKKAWQVLCNAYLIEASWYNDGYTPTFTEFIDNAYMSIGTLTIIRHAYWLTLTSGVPEDALQRIDRAKNMIKNVSLIVRLTNDIGTSFDELARGDVPSSIQCYMKETRASEAEARAYIRRLILETWKKMNKERKEIGSEYPQEFVESVVNLARMGHFMYTDRDMHGKPQMFKPYALSMFFNPIQGMPNP